MQIKPVILDGLLMYKVKDVFTSLGLTDYRKQVGNLTSEEYSEDFNALTVRGMLKVVFGSRGENALDIQAEVAKTYGCLQLEALQPSIPAATPLQTPQLVDAQPKPTPKPKPKGPTPVMVIDPDIKQVLDLYIANAMPGKLYDSFVIKAKKLVDEFESNLQKCIETYDMPSGMWFTHQHDQLCALEGDLERKHIDQDPLTCWAPETTQALLDLHPRRQKDIEWDKELKKYRLPGLPKPKK